jgi:hypothetical protein
MRRETFGSPFLRWVTLQNQYLQDDAIRLTKPLPLLSSFSGSSQICRKNVIKKRRNGQMVDWWWQKTSNTNSSMPKVSSMLNHRN